MLQEVLGGEKRKRGPRGVPRSESPSESPSGPPSPSQPLKPAPAKSAGPPTPAVAPERWGGMAGGSLGDWAGGARLAEALRGGASGRARGGGKVRGKKRRGVGASAMQQEIVDIAEQVRVKRAAVAKMLSDPTRRPLPRSPARLPRQPLGTPAIQGYLAHGKLSPRGTLQQPYA